jgi:hypothetical protein
MAEATFFIAGELRCSSCHLKNFQCFICLESQKEQKQLANKIKRQRPPKSPDKKLIDEHPAVMQTMQQALDFAEANRKEEATPPLLLLKIA